MFGQRSIIGLDIGSSTVKAIQLRKKGESWMLTAGAIVGIHNNGSATVNNEHIIRAISDCLRIAGIKNPFAVCSLNGSVVAIRNFDFPSLPDDELDTAVLLEARQVCPFTTTDIAVDYSLVPDQTQRSKGYLVAATYECLNKRLKLIKRSHVNCVLMDADALALLNCFKEIEKPSEDHGIALLNIGSKSTELAIEGPGGWPFARNLNFSCDDMINELSEQKNIPVESIQKMLNGSLKEIPIGLQDAFIDSVSKLVTEIEKTLRYYSVQNNSFEIKKILLSGGVALFGEFVKMLNNQLNVEVKIWNPFDKIKCYGSHSNHRNILLKNTIHKSGPAMAIAAGLAMRAV